MTPADAKRIYRWINTIGATITLRRVNPSPAAPTDVTGVRARVRGYAPEELVSGLQQGDRQVILPAENVGAFPVPFKTGGTDKIILDNGKVLNIQIVDEQTVEIDDEIIAYKFTARG